LSAFAGSFFEPNKFFKMKIVHVVLFD
jgi:hypothetical protein